MVRAGLKPAALGFWQVFPSGILRQELQRVPGRYYKWAIARTIEDLHRVVAAYYLPISPDADRYLGLALGYSCDSVDNYVLRTPYRTKKIPKWKTKWWKIVTTAEKLGWIMVIKVILWVIFLGDAKTKALLKMVLKKEGF